MQTVCSRIGSCGSKRWLCYQRRNSNNNSNKCIAVRKVATPLRELTCHMGSHSVTCHPAEMTFPPLPSRSWYSIKRLRRDARLSWPTIIIWPTAVPSSLHCVRTQCTLTHLRLNRHRVWGIYSEEIIYVTHAETGVSERIRLLTCTVRVIRLQQRRTAGLLLSARGQEISTDSGGRPAAAAPQHGARLSSKRRQCRVDSRVNDVEHRLIETDSGRVRIFNANQWEPL